MINANKAVMHKATRFGKTACGRSRAQAHFATDDKAAVTCKRCLVAMTLPAGRIQALDKGDGNGTGSATG